MMTVCCRDPEFGPIVRRCAPLGVEFRQRSDIDELSNHLLGNILSNPDSQFQSEPMTDTLDCLRREYESNRQSNLVLLEIRDHSEQVFKTAVDMLLDVAAAKRNQAVVGTIGDAGYVVNVNSLLPGHFIPSSKVKSNP
jgi:hypothetical protein